jgi:hypothetical protein
MAAAPPVLSASISNLDKQGTVVFSSISTLDPTRGSVQLVTITPDNYKTGDVLEVNGDEYEVTSVIKPNIKTKSGSTMLQKSATIELPENTTQPVKRFSFLMVKSF